MHRILRIRQGFVAVSVATMVLASAATAGASGASATYNAANAKLVPALYKGKTLAVATDATYAPDESMNGSTMVGFDVDLMKAIATTLGLKIQENNVTFDNIIAGIKSGKYVIGNSSFTDNLARQKQVNFVDYFQAGEGVYAAKNSMVTFKGFKSFCGLKVAVETGTVEQTDAQNASKLCKGAKKVTVLEFPTQTEANVAVSSGHANVGFLDSQIAGYVVSQSKGKFKLVGSAVNVAPYGIATPKTTAGAQLALAIQAALKTLVMNGTYKAILTKWGVAAGALPIGKIVLNGATS
ncbi:MAG: ABC transporter substrate-binding protein [Acidobacteriota bacterium]|nr:ABC transporter substrate-binding protein [Acidobacteriota bacterium]MDE3043690.1 ABC transporter substrate-binding protein [Acidobacteriota bacterium]MDE3106999.1 ABC transporter substrate-binding protein [Acidobacteriota bacterium]MDE3222466.1 ABC transporter substrate-binding protein [Acidobacteriota bacterium]